MTDRLSNRTLGLSLLMLAAGMVLLAFASVPLYSLFCQVTGFGGTTQQAGIAPGAVGTREITVRFNAEVDPSLPWQFRPQQREVTVHIGEERLAHYYAENRSDKPVTGTAIYNVTPHKAGQYFEKIHCFCFEEQTLEPGRGTDMPVSFFLSPEFLSDPEMADVKVITLSYTFFPKK